MSSRRIVTLETIMEFGIGFCAKGIMADRIAIPISNPDGQVVAYAGRFPGEPDKDNSKYKLPPGFKKSQEVFNLDRAIREPKELPLVIVEGFFDCMMLHQNGCRKVVALMGSFLSPAQEELIRQQVTRDSHVIVILDENEAGQAGRDDNPSLKVKNAAIVCLILSRIAQLNSILDPLRQGRLTKAPAQELPPIVPNNSPNSEDVEAVVEFQNAAQVTLQAFFAKKEDPFFKQADTIKNAPELPTDLALQISKLNTQYLALLQKPYAEKLVQPAWNECAAVQFLASWPNFTLLLRTGNIDLAGSILQKALRQKPTVITADYLPLWQIAENWQKVYTSDSTAFYDHLRKAQSFADLGKTSAAIQEYQAAFAICEDSTIPDKIKKLREQSLGL